MYDFGKPFDDILFEDIQQLVEDKIEEGSSIDYKKTQYDFGSTNQQRRDDQKKEYRSDLASFANSFGGYLILGVKEVNGIPESIVGLGKQTNLEYEIQQLLKISRNGIEPLIPAVRIRSIVHEETPVILIRIGKSPYAPHAVPVVNNHRDSGYKFFARTANGKHTMDVPEIRSSLLMAQSFSQRVEGFRIQRFSRLIANESPVKLGAGPKFLIHIVSSGPQESYLEIASLFNCEPSTCLNALPNSLTWTKRFNFDGVVFYPTFTYDKTKDPIGYLQIFRNGWIESAEEIPYNDDNQIFGSTLNASILQAAKTAVSLLPRLEVSYPIYILLSITGIRGFELWPGPYVSDVSVPRDPKFNEQDLIFGEIAINSADADFHLKLKPVIDNLWQSAAYPRSPDLVSGVK